MRWFLIDKYFDIKQGESLKAMKLISCNEKYFDQHYPWQPVFPPTLMIEMMAQAGGVLSGISLGFQKEIVLGKVEKCEFYKEVMPPKKLIIESKLATIDENSSWTEMTIKDEDGEVAKSRIMFAFLTSFGIPGAEGSIIFTDEFLNSYGLAEYKRSGKVSCE